MKSRELQHVLIKHKRWTRNGKGQKADLRRANLRGANLRRSDLRGADLRRSDLRWADLRGANLRGANLRRSDLRWADLRGADLRETGIIISHFVVWHVCAHAETLRIGCEVHDWNKWERDGEEIAKLHNVHDEFVAYWQVLCAMRDSLCAIRSAKHTNEEEAK